MAVPFLEGSIPCVEVDGEPMVILRPIAELLGLAWSPQRAKLSADQTACVTFIVTQLPGDDQARKVMAVSLETFTVWLARLQPSRVAPEARDTVIAYQREAARALREHFFGARTEPVRKPASGIALLEEMVAELRAQHERTAVLEAKVEAIEGDYRSFTALAFAKLHDYPTNRPYLAKVGRRATQIMRDRGETPHKRQDATFGQINVYPSDVLELAFEEVEQ
ncbi:phage antirepressor N-terminal domain-containing protein [Actinomadura sp. 21ATH]|uniref:phage antirepressor N-terminal domain-containing protein n=1 Tax=Actinomadura sp. 21ATH TaxID=1735444 RepID=UPI0035BF6143